MAIIHSLKCTVPFSFVVPLLSLALIHCHLLSIVVTRCIARCTIRCHSLSFIVTGCHSLSLVCTTRCHSLSFAGLLVITRCHSLSLDVPLACLFINNHGNVLKLMLFQVHCELTPSYFIKKHKLKLGFHCQKQPPRCSVRKGVLRNFTKFTGKHLCQNFFFNNVVGLRPATLLKKRL